MDKHRLRIGELLNLVNQSVKITIKGIKVTYLLSQDPAGHPAIAEVLLLLAPGEQMGQVLWPQGSPPSPARQRQ